MTLYKYQGAGNDFLIADGREGAVPEDAGFISRICDRRYGIGADGYMVLKNGTADFHMEYYNSDGSGGMMCGNGGRCIVAFAADCGVKPSLMVDGIPTYTFTAADGPHIGQVLSDGEGEKIVRIKMKDAMLPVHHHALSVNVPSCGDFIDTGTRHYVRMVEGLDSYPVVAHGREIRHAAEFAPVGVNVNFIEACGSLLKVRTFEKGVEDETYACGTGIVASCICAYVNGIQPSHMLPSGAVSYDVNALRDRLSVDFLPIEGGFSEVCLTGPAARVASVELSFIR